MNAPSRLKPMPWEEALVSDMLNSLQRVGGHEPVNMGPADVRRWACRFAAHNMDGGVTEENIALVTRRAVHVNQTLASEGMRFYRVAVGASKPSSMNGTMLKTLLQVKTSEVGPESLSLSPPAGRADETADAGGAGARAGSGSVGTGSEAGYTSGTATTVSGRDSDDSDCGEDDLDDVTDDLDAAF